MSADLLHLQPERLLVVQDPGDLAGHLRERYPQFDVTVSATYLEGITSLAGRPARGVLVGVDPAARKFGQAVAGLRKAAGGSSRVVLCCTPSGEPTARDALDAGANDYLIYPPEGDELDQALALGPVQGTQPAPGVPVPTWDELAKLAAALAGLGEGRTALIERICRILADSMRTPDVRITVEGAGGHVGDLDVEPALIEPIVTAGRTLGQICVGPRRRSPFNAAEAEKLRHYSRLIGHLLDVCDRQNRWQRLALTDTTTQLPNRRYLMQALESILTRARTDQLCVTLLMFDLDGFKHFNDTYGHAAGDEIIRDTGQLFRRHCRTHDVVARYAGDEFVVVFWDAERPRVAGSRHPSDAINVLARFKRSLESHEFPKLGPEACGHITISGGLASFPWDAQTGDDLIARADEALLQAKRDGKNRIYLVGAERRDVNGAEPAAPDSQST